MKKSIPVVILDRAEQIAPDKWDEWQECLTCTEDTTIKQIMEWIKLRTKCDIQQISCKIVFSEVMD